MKQSGNDSGGFHYDNTTSPLFRPNELKLGEIALNRTRLREAFKKHWTGHGFTKGEFGETWQAWSHEIEFELFGG